MKSILIYRRSNRQDIAAPLLRITWDSFLSVFLIVCMSILAGANTSNPDLLNYINSYSNPTMENGAYLNYAMIVVSNRIGLSFSSFRMIQYILGFFVLLNAIRRIANNTGFVLVYYCFVLLLMDSTQTLNFMGMCFFYLGLSFYFNNKKYPQLKFVLCILIASGFHTVFLFYSFMPFFIYFAKVRATKQLVMLVAGVITAFSILVSQSSLSFFVQFILENLNMEYYLGYLNSETRFGHLIPILLHLICTFICYQLYRRANLFSSQRNAVLWILCLVELYGFFSFPLFRFQSTLFRITRNLTLVPALAYCKYNEVSEHPAKRYKYWILLLALVLGVANTYYNYWDDIVIPFFTSNWVLFGA